MLLFAHLGITLGTAVMVAGANERLNTINQSRASEDLIDESSNVGKPKAIYRVVGSWFETLGRNVDIRALLLGSLISDIIDKPIGHWLLADSLNNGRIFSHSLIFFVLLLLTGWFLHTHYGNSFVLGISFGVFMHLILDSMWLNPRVLLWPFLGFAFEQAESGNFFIQLLNSLRHIDIFIPEIIGLLIVCGFGFLLIKKKVIWQFLMAGHMDLPNPDIMGHQ